jgi:hypothetical protein
MTDRSIIEAEKSRIRDRSEDLKDFKRAAKAREREEERSFTRENNEKSY